MATRLGVDVGGTFTDLISYDDETGEVRVAKELTTPAAPDEGVLRAVSSTVPADWLSAARYFLHGTTVGLNSLLTRSGAVVALFATRGFRDILEVRRGDRPDPYDLFPRLPEPLVPRRLRISVTERSMADGTVHIPLEEEDVRSQIAMLEREGVTSVAIAFLHSYANPEHELAAERVLREQGFSGEISLSHQVSGEYREYERTSTTVIDAYVRPRMTVYLKNLERRLTGSGFGGEFLVTRCGGGALTFSEAEARPFETILSGPVAGAEGAAELARNLELGDVITADVGGTSFDTCLVTGGRPQIMYEGSVVGLPVQTPWVDVRSIGAGGGSIAYVDVGGLLRVGPRSAGADPGPACYGKGGTEPTVTDAAFVLGMLGAGRLASGISLDVEKARESLVPLAEKLGFDKDEVARGIITIVSANMANAIREITVEQGQDPRRATLVTFGGAGSLFGTLLARELDVGRIVVPPHAGNFSTWGLLGANLTQEAARTRILRLREGTVEEADAIAQELFEGLVARTSAPNGGASQALREISLDIRYLGQEHTITVGVPAQDGRLAASADEVRTIFTQEYERTFAHTMEEQVEIVSVRASLRTPLPRRTEHLIAAASGDGARRKETLQAFSFSLGDWLDFPVIERTSFSPGDEVPGPAIILEETATTYLDAEFDLKVDGSGALFLTDSRAA